MQQPVVGVFCRTSQSHDDGLSLMRIVVDITSQTLRLFDAHGREIRQYRVSTALNGPGEREGSGCTPRGRHTVRAKIGAGAPSAAVFRGRRATGEVWSPEFAEAHPGRDWILSRILWLSGSEPGRNRLGNFDSMRRYIYIHGTPDDQPMGVPLSHGCVRMRNADVIELFDLVPVGTTVDIQGPVVSANDKDVPSHSGVSVTLLGWADAADSVMPVRETVFVYEQGVPPELERDEHDPVCRHAVARTSAGEVIGTGRLLPDGHIGRMAVLRPWRGAGVGGRVLEALIDEARLRGMREVMLNAQLTAEDFYHRHGFVAEGDVFMDAGIEHRAMRRSL